MDLSLVERRLATTIGLEAQSLGPTLIRKAIEEFSKGRTTFLISHSLGTIQFADRIILIDEGQIVAIGTDQELRRSSPLYRRLHEIHYHPAHR